jgi:hypothetical protein
LAHGATTPAIARAPAVQFTTLVGIIGTDTVAVDRYTRDGARIEGIVFMRRPDPHTMQYKATLAPEGRFTQMEIVWRDAKGVEIRAANISYGVDSIRTAFTGSTVRNTGAPSSLDAIPLPPMPDAAYAYGLLEHAATVFLMAPQNASPTLSWYTAGTAKAESRRVRRMAGDTIEIDYIGGPVRVWADPTKRIVWFSVGAPPRRALVTRAAKDVGIQKLHAAFLTRDKLDQPPQQPRDE